jgi:hypothetical protein
MNPNNLNPESEWLWLWQTIHSPEYQNFSQMQKEILFEFQLMLNSLSEMKNGTEKQLLLLGYQNLKQVF